MLRERVRETCVVRACVLCARETQMCVIVSVCVSICVCACERARLCDVRVCVQRNVRESGRMRAVLFACACVFVYERADVCMDCETHMYRQL